MKLHLGQKIGLVCLTLGFFMLASLGFPFLPRAQAASETAWEITDMDNAVIDTPRSMFFDGWVFQFKDSSGVVSYGEIYDCENNFSDGDVSGSPEPLRIDVVSWMESPNIQAGDTLTLTSDGTPSSLTVYLPALSGDDSLWVADDGSTYYDDALTSLAYEAPIEIEISISSSAAYDFSSSGPLFPDQTYTSSNNVRSLTVICNNSSGWKLYVKSTGNFISGGNTININVLEWSWDDASPSWTDMSTTDTSVRSSSDPTSASGVTTGMEYRVNIPYGNTPASDYTAKITFTAVVQ
jgi:hypothetical protein